MEQWVVQTKRLLREAILLTNEGSGINTVHISLQVKVTKRTVGIMCQERN